MFTETKMDEVEVLIKKQKELEMQVANFSTLQATRGYQFGREMFTSMILFKDLYDFLTVFPAVQRDVNKTKVGKIKTYILTGLEDRESLRFFSAVTVTCRGNVFFDEVKGRIAIDTRDSKLSINDGQHRFYAIIETINFLKEKHFTTTDKHRKAGLLEKINFLESMTIPLVIFNNISQREEKQLFHDINLLASRPSRSATIKLAQTDLVAVLTREIAQNNKFLINYGVEYEKANISPQNPNFILLTTIYIMIKDFYREVNESGKNLVNLSEENYDDAKIYINDTFDEIFRALPHDCINKDVYLLHRHFMMKGIGRFIKKARKDSIPEPIIFGTISRVDWTANEEYWRECGARMGERFTKLVFPDGEKSISNIIDVIEREMHKMIEEGVG